jgi:RNA recognition motif-containing protein
MYSSKRHAPYKGKAREDDDEYETGGNSGTTVYVGNLPWDIEWRDLKDVMAQGGNVVRADVITNEEGRSRGFGICEFATAEDAANAIELLQNAELDGRPLEVRMDRGGGRGGRGGRGGSRGGSRGRGRGGGRGRGRGRGGGRGRGEKKPASKDGLDDDLDSYWGKEVAESRSSATLDADMDDYFGKPKEAPAATEAPAVDA